MDEISIHSTARVETIWEGPRCTHLTDFNPLHREGGDTLSTAYCASSGVFQSTPPRGWRPKPQTITRLSSWNFNPLHREGGDKVIGMIFKRQAISIHSTARVETFSEPFKVGNPLFQSTPPRGWRLGIANVCRGHRNFNPLHREGGDGNYSKSKF